MSSLTAHGTPIQSDIPDCETRRVEMELAVLVQEARAWVADCEWGNLEAGEIAGLTDEAIVRGVERAYSGGWAGFVADTQWAAEA